MYVARVFLGMYRLTTRPASQSCAILPPTSHDQPAASDSDSDASGERLKWLARKMDKLARYEAGHHPKESLKRTCVFQWIAAVGVKMEDSISYLLPLLLPPLYKELRDKKKTAGRCMREKGKERE